MSILLDAVNRQQQEQNSSANPVQFNPNPAQLQFKRLGMILFGVGMVSGSAITLLYQMANTLSAPPTVEMPAPKVPKTALKPKLEPEKVALPLPEAQPWGVETDVQDDWSTDSAQPETKQRIQPPQPVQQPMQQPKPKVALKSPVEPKPQAQDADNQSQLKTIRKAWLEQKVLDAAQEVLDEQKNPTQSKPPAKPKPVLDILMSVHQYSPSAKNRYLLIDSNFVHEGDTLKNGAKLLQIRANDALFDYQGERITLNVVDD